MESSGTSGQGVCADKLSLAAMIMGALVVPPALVLGVLMMWAWGYVFFGGHDGRYHPQAFLDAHGELRHVSGHAFKGGKIQPCEVVSSEVLSYKETGDGSIMYSCSRWWLDNIIVLLGETFNDDGSRYYAVHPKADVEATHRGKPS